MNSDVSLEDYGLWRRPYGILIAGILTSLAEKVADMDLTMALITGSAIYSLKQLCFLICDMFDKKIL